MYTFIETIGKTIVPAAQRSDYQTLAKFRHIYSSNDRATEREPAELDSKVSLRPEETHTIPLTPVHS